MERRSGESIKQTNKHKKAHNKTHPPKLEGGCMLNTLKAWCSKIRNDTRNICILKGKNKLENNKWQTNGYSSQSQFQEKNPEVNKSFN